MTPLSNTTLTVSRQWGLFSNLRQSGIIFVGSGCVAARSHQGGGTHVFVDGHAKWLKGNSERYEEKDVSGCWFKRYYTIDK